MAPHAQSQVVGAGRCVPHSGQKCPCSALAPHVGLGQSHVSGAGRGAHGGRDGLARRLAHGPHHPEGEAELHNLADGGASAAGTAPGADDAVLHGLLAHLALRLLLIGVALHTHLLGFGRGHAAHGLGLAAGLDGTDTCLGLRLHGHPFGLGLRFALADLLLANLQVEIGVLLAQTLIVGVVVRRDHAADDELRRLQAVLGEFPVDVRAQRLGELREVFVHLQDVDGAFADASRQTALHLRHDHRHRHVVRVPAQRAHGRRRGLLHVQGQAALLAGDLRVLPLERRGVDGLAADRADGLLPLALVEDHHVAALLAAAAGQLLGLDVNHVPAAARLLPEPKEPQERLSSPVAKRVASRK